MAELWAWMNGELVGIWSQGRTGHHRFRYDPTWLESTRVRPLSLSMPITSDRTVEGDAVGAYFDNLLPDNELIRKRLSTRFKTKTTQAFELLQAIGRDCVGAVQLMPPDTAPVGFDKLAYEELGELDVERILQGVVATPGTGAADAHADETFRISIAGAQEKTALLRIGSKWCRPTGATPTTHILKLPLGVVGGRQLDLVHSIENEWLCAQILAELQLPVAVSEIAVFGGQKALVVERFDRGWVDGGDWIARLPQEDLCQALGQPSRLKYEADGGPGVDEYLKVLAGGEDFHRDGRNFLCTQLAFWLLAATDGHAKNFSIFLLEGGRYRATPLYDVLSAWPVIGPGLNKLPLQKARLAMAVRSRNKHYKIDDIQTRHWQLAAHKSGVDGAWPAMTTLIARIDGALTALAARLPKEFPAQTADAIFAGVRAQAELFARGNP